MTSRKAKTPWPSPDGFQKFAAELERVPLMHFLGIDPKLIPESVMFSPDEFWHDMFGMGYAKRLPDFVIRLGNGNIRIIEMRSTADDMDLFEFCGHAVFFLTKEAEKFDCLEDIPPIWVTSVYAATIEFRPASSYPLEEFKDKSSLRFRMGQIFLEDKIVMSEVVRKFRAAVEAWKKDRIGYPLSPVDFIELFLAPFGLLPDSPRELIEKYLGLGRDLSELTGDLTILGRMLNAVMIRGGIAAEDTLARFKEILRA
ncbi:MAG: hypothetical protein LBT40_01915 [Deltaproteobacteria bacterium]|nr:hypothetical protein [Deltaproteobacteria bacterium]